MASSAVPMSAPGGVYGASGAPAAAAGDLADTLLLKNEMATAFRGVLTREEAALVRLRAARMAAGEEGRAREAAAQRRRVVKEVGVSRRDASAASKSWARSLNAARVRIAREVRVQLHSIRIVPRRIAKRRGQSVHVCRASSMHIVQVVLLQVCTM